MMVWCHGPFLIFGCFLVGVGQVSSLLPMLGESMAMAWGGGRLRRVRQEDREIQASRCA